MIFVHLNIKVSMVCMQNNGRLFTKDWHMPIYSTCFRITLFVENIREEWIGFYDQKINRWIVNNETLHNNCSMSLSILGVTYFLSLTPPTPAYTEEIEEISEILRDTSGMKINDILDKIRHKKPQEKPSYKYYLGLLQFSNCFSKIKSPDTFGRKHTVWRINPEEFENFKRIKESLQNIEITVLEGKEKLRLFYAPKEPDA